MSSDDVPETYWDLISGAQISKEEFDSASYLKCRLARANLAIDRSANRRERAMTEDLPSRADDILDELERSQRSEAVIRMKMVGLSAEALRRIIDDEKRHMLERAIAWKVLHERDAPSMQKCLCGTRIVDLEPTNRFVMEDDKGDIPQLYCSICKIAAEREAAHARVDLDEPEPTPAPAVVGNQVHAEAFAKILRDARIPCQVMGTQAIAGRGPVKDGWVVNYHCPDTEIGLVAAWWGRGHFTAYLEIAGHHDRTEETAALLVKAFAIARQQ